MQDSIARACLATTQAGGSATHALDTVGLTRDVMEVYDSLSPEQRSKTGTEEYRQLFQAVDSIGSVGLHDIGKLTVPLEIMDKSTRLGPALKRIQERFVKVGLLNQIAMLSIRKGTLTDEERAVMQGHATSTWNILNQVQYPAQYASIPLWAASHHELLQGKGYPRGLSGDAIPREVRLLTILDIFEALTAKDRPYKKPYTLDKTWQILGSMVQDGSLDGDMLSLFRESHAWEKVVSSEKDAD